MSFVSDTFTDTTGLALASHVPEQGTSLTKHPEFASGAFVIQANRARCSTSTAVYYYGAAPPDADHSVEGIMKVLSLSGKISVAGRISPSAKTMYYLGWDPTTGIVSLNRQIAGVPTTLIEEVLLPGVVGAEHALRLEMAGSLITAQVDDQAVLSAKDTAITAAGRVGLRANSSSGATTGIHMESLVASDIDVPVPVLSPKVQIGGVAKDLEGFAYVGGLYKPLTAIDVSDAPPIPPDTPWVGDFDTGDLSQYTGSQLTDAQSLMLVTTPRRTSSGYAARFQIDPGENAGVPPSTRDRAELTLAKPIAAAIDGHECWYGWSSFFPHLFASPHQEALESINPHLETVVNVFNQFHEPSPTWNEPPVLFYLDASKGTVDPPAIKGFFAGGGTFPKPKGPHLRPTLAAHVIYNAWWDFVLHINWSPDPEKGFVEVWAGLAGTLEQGSPTVPKTFHATLFPAPWDNCYMKEGFYKDRNGLQSVIYRDCDRRGNSFAEVCPSGTPS